MIGDTSCPSPNSNARRHCHATHLAKQSSLTSVVITGDMAVLTFTLNKPDTPKRVMSSDIFVYREGRWHALYSQHTAAGI